MLSSKLKGLVIYLEGAELGLIELTPEIRCWMRQILAGAVADAEALEASTIAPRQRLTAAHLADPAIALFPVVAGPAPAGGAR